MAKTVLGALVLLWCVFITGNVYAGENIVAWYYYRYPPFVTGEETGLSHDFIALLNKTAKGQFVFHLELYPRKRLDLYLENEMPGIVLFVNPAWMGLKKNAPVVWTPTIFNDSNAIISNVSKKVNYTGPESVYGMKMGGIFGRKYKDLDEPIAKKLIKRQNARNEEVNVLKVSERRVDFITGPESVMRYLVATLGVQQRVYFSPTPLFEYTRHILLSAPSPQLKDFLFQFVADLPGNPEWEAIKAKYQLQ